MAREYFLPPITKPTKDQARIILNTAGLGALKSKFYRVGDIPEADRENGKSALLGTAVFDNLIIKRPTYSVLRNDEFVQNSSITTEVVVLSGNTYLPDPAAKRGEEEDGNEKEFNAFRIDTLLMEVNMQRNIIATPVAGRNGTEKEYVSNGDYVIRIAGFIEAEGPDQHPTLDTGILRSYFDAPVALEVVSDYLNIFGVANMVITDYRFPQTEGRRNLQYFEATAISDETLIQTEKTQK